MNTRTKLTIGAAIAAGCVFYASANTEPLLAPVGLEGELFPDPAACTQSKDGLELWYAPNIPADFTQLSSRADTVYFHGVRFAATYSVDSVTRVSSGSRSVAPWNYPLVFTERIGPRVGTQTRLSDLQYGELLEQFQTAVTYCEVEPRSVKSLPSYAIKPVPRRFI